MRVSVLAPTSALALLLSSCLPSGESKVTTELRARIDRLEAALKDREIQITEEKVAAQEALSLVKDRVEQVERSNASGGVHEVIARQLELTQAQLLEFQGAINSLLEISHTGQNWIRFGLGYAGHAVARTPHGSFLVELRSQESAGEGKGHVVKLRIGNSTSLTVHKFKLSGHFGAPPPEAKPGAPLRPEAQSDWESRLRPFEQSFTTVLPNAAWKEVDLLLPAERLADLRFIRMRMEVERASLPEASEVGPERLRIGLDSKGGFILHTDHGAIIMALEGYRKTAGGHELIVRFGNPLGLTVTRCTLQGRHGPDPPKIEAFPDFEKYRFALSEWQQRVRPFEIEVPGELAPSVWNPKTLKFPTRDSAELAFIECRLVVKNVSLRQP